MIYKFLIAIHFKKKILCDIIIFSIDLIIHKPNNNRMIRKKMNNKLNFEIQIWIQREIKQCNHF